jgi:hypothetical protein
MGDGWMRRLTMAFLIASLLGIGVSPVVVAQSEAPEAATTAGPVVLGGRIEVPSANFALTMPEGWYAFDLSDPDLIAEMEAFDETTAALAPSMESLSLENAVPDLAEAYPLVGMPLMAFAAFLGPTGGENCNVVVEPFASESLDLLVAAQMLTMRAGRENAADLEPVFIDLPAGRVGMVEYASSSPAGTELEATVFFLLHDGQAYSMTCADATRHADRWLSIAESFEFLTTEA